MGLLLPIGAVLIAIGTAGSAVACVGDTSPLLLAPLSGLTLAIGLVCMGIGIGNWRRPVPSDVRPANPWNDQPRESGKGPVGQV